MSAEITTLMVRRVPRKYSETMLLAEFDALGAFPDFDFFFLPWEVKRNSNSGFAFINFRSAAAAERFTNLVQDRAWPSHTAKFIEVSAAAVQGLVPNLVNLVGNSKVEEWPNHAPVIVHGGKRLAFQDAVDLLVPRVVLYRLAEAAPEVEVCRAQRLQVPPESAVPATVLAKVSGGANATVARVISKADTRTDELSAAVHALGSCVARQGQGLRRNEWSSTKAQKKIVSFAAVAFRPPPVAFRPPPGLS